MENSNLEKKEIHESYGLVSFSRVSGGHGILFGSELSHDGHISLKISRGEVSRSLSREWYRDREQLIQVSMTEQQFAELITSFNRGVGTPCTIGRFDGERINPPPAPKSEKEKIESELNESVKDAFDSLTKLELMLAGLSNNKKPASKAEIKEALKLAQKTGRELTDSLPFIAESYKENLNKILSSAKLEFESYAKSILPENEVRFLPET